MNIPYLFPLAVVALLFVGCGTQDSHSMENPAKPKNNAASALYLFIFNADLSWHILSK